MKVKEKFREKMESVDKEKFKKNVKRVVIGAGVMTTGFVGYGLGRISGVFDSGRCVNKVLEEHPDLKDKFFEAWDETFTKINK